jgi:hypothetical protein
MNDGLRRRRKEGDGSVGEGRVVKEEGWRKDERKGREKRKERTRGRNSCSSKVKEGRKEGR